MSERSGHLIATEETVTRSSMGVDRGHDCEVLAFSVNPLDGRDHKPCMPEEM